MDSDSESSRNENRNSIFSDVKEIKQMLLSGDKQQVLRSIEKVKFFLRGDESLVNLISCDISEFLCDALSPFEAVTCRAVYSCLECMIQHADFFVQSHSCYVVESLIRSIHFLVKNSNSDSTLSDSLNLFVLITEGYNNFNVNPEKKTIKNILQLISVLLKSSVLTVRNKYQVGCIILNLANSISNCSLETLGEISKKISDWIDLINEIFRSENPLRENIIFLCCLLCHFALKSIISKDSLSDEISFEDRNKLKGDLPMKISNFVINIQAPYLDGLPLSVIESEPAKAEYFFQVLLYYYGDEMSSEKNHITHGLSEMGFLQFLTRVISFADFENGQKLRKLGVLVLSRMISSLSEDVFDITETWPKGLHDFRIEMQLGFSNLPLDASQWLDVLTNPHSLCLSKVALLLYLYFYCMTAKSQNTLETIYPSMVTFINFSTGLESSALLVKVVWFVYVISRLSWSQEDVQPKNEVEASVKMASILKIQKDLTLMYTHHPALLYWAFCSEIDREVQSKIVHLWLRNKSADCKELEELIKKSSDVRFAILVSISRDVVQNESGHVLDSAFSTLNSILTESSDEDDLISNLWFLLPQILARYTTDSASAKNVDYSIELCSLRTPRSFDVTRVIRVASLLPEVLVKSDLIAIVPSLTLTLRLLELGFRMDDPRVMNVFLRSDAFLAKIAGGIGSEVFEIARVSLKVVTLLWENCDQTCNSEERKKIKLAGNDLLASLNSNHAEVLGAGLELLKAILRTGFRSKIFQIDETDANFFEILFFEVQNACLRDISEVTPTGWLCLKSFLELEGKMPELRGIEFATDPLLHEIVRFQLGNLRGSREMKEFVIVWLDRNDFELNDPCLGRKICGGFFRESLRRIQDYLERNFKEDDRILYEKVLKFGRGSH